MKYFKLGIFGILSLLSACSQTYVHVINQGFSDEKLVSITKQLNNLDLVVIRENITIPSEFPAATIATHPNFSNLELFHQIESIVVDQGISKLQHLTFAQGRHFYNEQHIGLYLRNEDDKSHVMPAYLRTQYCKFADATIMFKNNGRFVLEFEKGKYEDGLAVVQGSYIFDGRRLSITTDNEQSQFFLLHQEMKQTHLGQRQADVFKPSTENKNLQPLNCEFLIIYME